MTLGFLKLPTEERRRYIGEAAARRDVSSVVLEKDFWVSWLLSVIFESPFAESLVFKGGTSLSKVFGIIQRFSEDIDLSLAPAFLKLDVPKDEISRNQADKWMKRAEELCGAAVQEQIMPVLEARIVEILGRAERPWLEFLVDDTTNSPVILFHYPSIQADGFAYLRRSVKLEFGSLTDQQPVGRHTLKPWIAEVLPAAFPDWRCEVVALEVERSFWEKATILHEEYHRPEASPTPDRYSRHYADTATMAKHEIGDKAMEEHALRDRVVSWKGRFFRRGWSNFHLAKPGTFRLVPQRARQSALRDDYEQMRDMYLSSPVSFDEILTVLEAAERRINQSAAAADTPVPSKG